MKKILIFAVLSLFLGSFIACRSSKKKQKNQIPYVLKEELPNSNATTPPVDTKKTSDLAEEFSSQLQTASGANVQIARTDNEIAFSFEPTIKFESNSDILDDIAQDRLAKTAKVLSKYNYLEIFIEGHADSSGVQVKNKKLSQDRAKNVALFFKNQGVKTERLAISGYGATRPIVSNETPEGRRKNRRVFIKLRVDTKQFEPK